MTEGVEAVDWVEVCGVFVGDFGGTWRAQIVESDGVVVPGS